MREQREGEGEERKKGRVIRYEMRPKNKMCIFF